MASRRGSDISARPMNLPVGMPAPVPTRLDAPFWLAASEDRLAVQRCTVCGRHRFPPTESCYVCQSVDGEWDTLPGTGTIASFVWLPHADIDGPPRYYNVALIALDGTSGEPVRMLSNVIDAWEIGELEVGEHVVLECVSVGDVTLPCFRRTRLEQP